MRSPPVNELFAWDLPEDFADGCQTITYWRRGRPPGVTVAGAICRPVSPTRIDRRNGWAGADAVWHIPEGRLPGPARPGDVLQDATGRRWTVLVVSAAATGRLVLWTRDWAASFSAAQSADVEVAETTQGPDGEPVIHWRPYLTGVPIQFHSSQSQTPNAEGQTPTYRVLVVAELPSRTLRLKTSAGVLYWVDRVERPGLPGHPAVLYVHPITQDVS